MTSEDPYSILGLSRSATDLEINKAYRNLSLRCKNQTTRATTTTTAADDAEAKFQRISDAYRLLSNNQLRMVYDKYGKNGLIEAALLDLDPTAFKALCGEFPLRDAKGVSLEYYGGRKPTYTKTVPGSCRIPSSYDEHCFENSFPGFVCPSSTKNLKNTSALQHTVSSPVYQFAGSMFSGPNDEGDYESFCKTKVIRKGNERVTYREILNNDEKVTVEENGVLVSKTINGLPQSR